MGVGLQPLEFSECLADSPQFRENLHNHEKELERTSQQIKRLIKEVKDTVHAAKRLRAAQLALATSMEQLEFACIGASMTDDELAISHSLSHLATLIRTVEDERDRMLGRAHEQIIEPLERFRKEHIGAVKEGKKKFDKKTAKFCQTQERTLGLSTKKPDNVFQEADAGMEMAERDFCAASLEYVFLLQAVQERKKFELVETLLGFVFGWWTFHHQAHEVHNDAEPLVRDLQLRIQRTRTNFEETSKQTESLMKKMMEMRQTCAEEGPGGGAAGNSAGGLTRAGYLFLMERKAFGTAWTKHYCTYERTSSLFTLTPYNQINVKTTGPTDSVCLCGARRAADAVERRFCWEALPAGGERPPLTLQALSERDRTRWLRAIRSAEREERDAVPPAYALDPGGGGGEPGCALDEAGFAFVRRIIGILESRGLDEQGLYRVAGVASKVSRLVACAADPRRLPATLNDPLEWETKTLTSALKSYLRALPEPLCTRRLHARWVSAAKREARSDRLGAMHALLHALPALHRDMLALVVRHLREVAARAPHNLMSASNLAVCFGPTLLRPERETVASIMELKFCNVVVETLIDNYDLLFLTPPPADGAGPAPSATVASIPPNGHIRAESAPPPPPPPPQPPAHAEPEWGTARYAALHHRLLHHYPALPPPPRGGVPSVRSDTSSTDSGSSASPPPHPPPPAHPPRALPHQAAGAGAGAGAGAAPSPLYLRHPRYTRVRTLYACLGESEGELSFEPNQIITNVSASAEPGWLTGTLNGATGLVPENYVEPLP